jgi:phosphoglycolate/pyridoxal phosphate phosphatase family enzyme
MQNAMAFSTAAAAVFGLLHWRRQSKGVGVPELTNCEGFLASVDTFMLDMDGVLWKGGDLLDGTIETLQMLKRLGKRVYFITNNSKSRVAVCQKCTQLGIEVTPDQIITASSAVALYLSTRHKSVKRVYLSGSLGLAEELENVGIQGISTSTVDKAKTVSSSEFLAMEPPTDIGAVVVGGSFSNTFWEVCFASLCLQKLDIPFLCTSRDSFDQLRDRKIPGPTEGMVSIIEKSSGVSAIVCGKPSATLANFVIEAFNLNPSRTCMIGDRLDSDILFGRRAGFKTVLVMTGVTNQQQLAELQSDPAHPMRPTYFASHFGQLLR